MATSPRSHGRRSAPDRAGGELREAILAATAGLLAGTSFGDLAVGDILTAAGVSRGSFYFYFAQRGDRVGGAGEPGPGGGPSSRTGTPTRA